MPQSLPGVGHRLHYLNRRNDAQRAIILPARRHRVGMRTQHNSRRRRLPPRNAPDDITGRVNPHRHTRRRHQPDDVIPPGNVRRRERYPLHPRLSKPNLPQRRQMVIQAGCVNRNGIGRN